MSRSIGYLERSMRDGLSWAKRPPHLEPTFTAIYCVATLFGLGILTNPPRSVEGELGSVAMSMVGWVVTIAPAMAFFAVRPGWWVVERWCLYAMVTFGVLPYASIVTTLHYTAPGSRSAQFLFIFLGFALLFVRWLMIRKYDYRPRG